MCKTRDRKNGKINDEKFQEAKEKQKPTCAKNFDGLFGSMEEAAMRIWARSENQNKMRYVVYVGDGDVKTFTALQKMNNNRTI